MASTEFTRRLRAIAVIDVAGYSSLMESAEGTTHARVNTLFESVVKPHLEACAGRLIERAGDGLLVLFESSTQAVKCLVAVQRAVHRHAQHGDGSDPLRLRVGVNVGDIIIDGNEIAGDDVNIAVRLQSIAEPGTIVVSSAVREQLHEDLGATYVDLGNVTLKNIARPIHAFQLDPEATKLSHWYLLATKLRTPLRHPWLLGAALVLLLAAGLTRLPQFAKHEASDSPPMSVAVAAFEALPGADPGVADDLVAVVSRGLASTTWLRVAAPDIARRISGAAEKVTETGRDIHVRYVVVGKVDTRNGMLGVDVDLIDTTKGLSAWTSRVETKSGPNAPATLGMDVVILLREAIYDAESKRLVESGSSPRTAMEFKMLGDMTTDTHFLTLEAERKARKHYENALGLDPNFVPAMISVGYTLVSELDLNPAVDHAQMVERLDSISKHAVSRDPSSAPAWQFRAEALGRAWRWEAALDASSKAVALDPGRSFGYSQRANLLVLVGRPAEALVEIDKALGLAEQRSGYALLQKCRAEMALGEYRAAINSCQKSVSREEWWMQHAYLVSAYALADDPLSAAGEKQTLLRMYPAFSVDRVRGLRLSNVPAYEQEVEDHLYRGLRKAGIADKG